METRGKKTIQKNTGSWLDEGIFVRPDWLDFNDNCDPKKPFICTIDNKRFKTLSAAKNHAKSTAEFKLQEYYLFENLVFYYKTKKFPELNEKLLLLKSMNWRQYKNFYYEDIYGKTTFYGGYVPKIPNKTRRQWETMLHNRIQDVIDSINGGSKNYKEYKKKRNECLVEYRKRLAKEKKCQA